MSSGFNSNKNYPPNSSIPLKRRSGERTPQGLYLNWTPGDEFFDESTKVWWKYIYFDPEAKGVWKELANSPTVTESLTGDDGFPVIPVNNNININGNSNGVNGAISFSNNGDGNMAATVLPDNETIFINFDGLLSAGFVTTIVTVDDSETIISSLNIPNGVCITLKGTVLGSSVDHSDVTGGDFLVVADGTQQAIIGITLTNVMSSTSGSFNVTMTGSSLDITVTSPLVAIYNWKTNYSFITVE